MLGIRKHNTQVPTPRPWQKHVYPVQMLATVGFVIAAPTRR